MLGKFAATKRVLKEQDGQCILVGHSYRGAVITEAGTDPSVAGLEYVAAHMPDAGENEADDGKRFPIDLGKSTAIGQRTWRGLYLAQTPIDAVNRRPLIADRPCQAPSVGEN
jgi:hypothetical protein